MAKKIALCVEERLISSKKEKVRWRLHKSQFLYQKRSVKSAKCTHLPKNKEYILLYDNLDLEFVYLKVYKVSREENNVKF